jgi:hypothetical protein
MPGVVAARSVTVPARWAEVVGITVSAPVPMAGAKLGGGGDSG